MLSWGLNSSSIVCAARNILQNNGNTPLHTFSAIFPQRAELDCRIDERKYIHAVSSADESLHHDVTADQGTPLLDILWNQAEPIPAPNFYMDWLIYQAAQHAGVGILLSGLDGDTTVSYGYELYSELMKTGRWLKLAREIRAARDLLGWPVWGVVKRLCLHPLVPEPVLGMWRGLRGRQPPPRFKGLALNSGFCRRINLEERLAALCPPEQTAWRQSPRTVHLSHMKAAMMSNIMDMVRTASDATFIEIRFPYFDRRLMEFCLALPLEQKLQNGESRSIMRRSMADLMPQVVRKRFNKGSLSSNFCMGLYEYEEPSIREILTDGKRLLEEYLDMEGAKTILDKFADDPLECNEEAFNLFLVVVLFQWLKHSRING